MDRFPGLAENERLRRENQAQRELIERLYRALNWKYFGILLLVILMEKWGRVWRFVFTLVAVVITVVVILLAVTGLVLSRFRLVTAVNNYSDAGARCVCCAYGVPSPPRTPPYPYEPALDAN